MDIELRLIGEEDLPSFKAEIQEAFQKGFEAMNSGMSGNVVLDWTK